MKDKNLIINYSLYFIFGLIYIIILKQIFNIIDVFYNINYYLLTIIYIILGINVYKENKTVNVVLYVVFLIIFLFFRKSKTGFNFTFYLFDWISKIFKNKVIFINIIGNIILFIPFGIIMKNKIYYAFLIVIFIEVFQVILNRGLFDIVDIVLNYIGIIIGFMGDSLWMIIKKNKKI